MWIFLVSLTRENGLAVNIWCGQLPVAGCWHGFGLRHNCRLLLKGAECSLRQYLWGCWVSLLCGKHRSALLPNISWRHFVVVLPVILHQEGHKREIGLPWLDGPLQRLLLLKALLFLVRHSSPLYSWLRAHLGCLTSPPLHPSSDRYVWSSTRWGERLCNQGSYHFFIFTNWFLKHRGRGWSAFGWLWWSWSRVSNYLRRFLRPWSTSYTLTGSGITSPIGKSPNWWVKLQNLEMKHFC